MIAPQPGTLSRAKIHELESLLRNTLGYEMGDGKPVKARLYVGELRELLRGYRATDPKAQALADALRELTAAETEYRKCHDLLGASDMKTGRAWDAMRRASQRATAALAAWDAKP